MAGEFTGYYTYEDSGSDRRLKGMYGTQDAADDAALVDDAVTAFQGSTMFPNGIAIGWIYDTTDDEWRQQAVADLSDVDRTRASAGSAMDVLEGGLGIIARYHHLWPVANTVNAREGIHWQMVNMARVCLNSTRTHADRIKFCDEAASWPSGVNGDPLQYVDAMDTGVTLPTADWSWVKHDDLSRLPISGGTDNANLGFASAANVEDAPITAKLIGRAWINDIP